MLNETMWNIFKETGSIHSYLYMKEYKEYFYNKNEESIIYNKVPLEMKEITIMT